MAIALHWWSFPANAEFLTRSSNIPRRYLPDGTLIRTYGDGLFDFGEPLFTESIDGMAISPNGQELYVFGNDLGEITNFRFNLHTGEYLGTRGIHGAVGMGVWAAGFVRNVGISAPQTRTNNSYGNGDLFYIGRGWQSGSDVVNLVNASTGNLVGQIDAPGSIYDFDFAAGPLGPQTRVYVASSSGIYVYDELPAHSINPFALAFNFAMPAGISGFADIDIGPDGKLYILGGPSGWGAPDQFVVRRYDPLTGALIDIVASNEPFIGSESGLNFSNIQFGPGGDLYVTVDGMFGDLAEVHRYDPSSKQLVANYQGLAYLTNAEDFLVLSDPVDPVPEPGSGLFALLGVAALFSRLRRR